MPLSRRNGAQPGPGCTRQDEKTCDQLGWLADCAAGSRNAGACRGTPIVTPPPPRLATLVLVTPNGATIGAWPPFAVDTPWWQDIAPVVRAAREAHGVEVTLLRVLDAERAGTSGEITYLAEVAAPVVAEPWAGALDEQPLRLSYAKPGGPADDVAWALRILSAQGLTPTAPPSQVRTWNLSSLWRIPVRGQDVWLKVVPPF